MKVFLINFVSHKLVRKLSQQNIEVVYWIGRTSHFKYLSKDKQFLNTVFHSAVDAVRATPAEGVKNIRLEFPSGDAFRAVFSIEFQAIIMLSRSDYTQRMDYSQKRDLFYKHFIYWYGILRHFKPYAILLGEIPNTIHAYIIYTVAQSLGIKTIMHRWILYFPGRLLFLNDFTNYNVLREVYQQKLISGGVWDDLSYEMKRYVENQRKLYNDVHLPYSEYASKFIKSGFDVKGLISLRAIIRNIKQGSFFTAAYDHFVKLVRKKDFVSINEKRYSGFEFWWLNRRWKKVRTHHKLVYESMQTEVDFNKKYVYVPLHLQPENSTNPLGGIFDDQILMVRTIAAALPPGWLIYVKESPMQWLFPQGNFGRYDGYYQALCAIPSVRLVSIHTSTFKLIAGAQTIATLCSTAGFEALIRLKPVLVFGFAWYADCDGVLRVDDVLSCQKAFESILIGYKPNEDKVFAFLYALDQILVDAVPKEKRSQFLDIPVGEENTDKIVNVLLKELGLSKSS